MRKLRYVFSDQLSDSISSLNDIEKSDVIFFCEVMAEATYVKHHLKKLAFIFASMRHFASELAAKGCQIRYTKLTDPANTQSINTEIMRAVKDLNIAAIVVTEPSEYRTKVMVDTWAVLLGIPVEIRSDNRFLCSMQEFQNWTKGKKQLRMEYFYREMRKKYHILMDAKNSPIGGRWNYDKENRKSPPKGLKSPQRISHKKSLLLNEVLEMVKEKFADHFGDLEPFHYAVTREQALIELHDFIERILPYFGDYQDAMQQGEPYLYHSLLSSYINVGLLLPLEICTLVENAFKKGDVPLNAAEGFIRQILGWREFIRGIYWHKMPTYADLNFLCAHRPLPHFYWDANTKMNCIAEVVSHTKEHAYSHHIQRLMVTGNFALIAGLDVKQVQEWYLAVYSDAFEWVEMPNTLGMALFGDGGIVGSKPYAASGKYIHKMSNFCNKCCYNPNETLGENACPFNALYWDFYRRHREQLKSNQRLTYAYSTWDKFSAEKQSAITLKAKEILHLLHLGKL